MEQPIYGWPDEIQGLDDGVGDALADALAEADALAVAELAGAADAPEEAEGAAEALGDGLGCSGRVIWLNTEGALSKLSTIVPRLAGEIG